jgi:hypothetical protein
LDNVPIEPLWLCPLRLRDDRELPLYPLRPRHTYVNVGFWSSVPVGPDWPSEEGHTNKLIERAVSQLDGHKSLYSEAFYSADEFISSAVKQIRRRRTTIPTPARWTHMRRRCNDDTSPGEHSGGADQKLTG